MQEMIFLTLLVLLVSLAVYFARLCWRAGHNNGEDLILIYVLYANFFWALVPALLAIIFGEYDWFMFGYTLDVWSLGLLLEVIFFAVFALTMRAGNRQRTRRFASYLSRTPSPTRFLILVFCIAGFAYILLTGPWTNVGYEGVGRYIKENLDDVDFTIGGPQYTIYRAVLLPAICVLLFYVPKRQIPTWFRYSGFVIFAYIVLDSLASGVRGKVLEVVMAVAACMLVSGKQKRAFLYLVGGGLFLLLFSAAIVQFRGNAGDYAGESAASKSRSVLEASNGDSQSSDLRLWLLTYLIRLDSLQDGGILAHETAQSNSFAGFRPFVGTFVAFFPRYFWADKPLPLSRDGTVDGLPWYLVMAYRDEPWNNGSVSTSGIAYWQFGWAGVIFTAIFGAITVRCLAIVATQGGEVGLFLFLSFALMTHFRLPVAADETIFVILQVVMPLLLLHSWHVWRLQEKTTPQVTPAIF